MTSEFMNAERVHTAITAGIEKRVLHWLAARMPGTIHSDHLTVLALVAQILAGVAYAIAGIDGASSWALLAVNGFLALNWFGDSLDGTLARVRNQQRPRYGFYVDHVVDAMGAFALMTGMGLSGFLHWQIAAGLLVCFYALAIESYLATYTIGRFHLSHGWFGPTEIRIALMIGNALAFQHVKKMVTIAGHQFLYFDAGGTVAIVAMSAMFLIACARHTALLYRAERIR